MDNLEELNKPQRLVSLDALRGFDMFWIVGGLQLVKTSAEYFGWPWLKWLAGQMYHPTWEGFTAYDLICPLFLFIVGISITFSLKSKRSKAVSKWKIYLRVFRRFLVLLALGVIYNGGLLMRGFENTRYGSVLGFIGVGYFFASLIVMNSGIRGQIIWFIGILLGYWAAVSWVSVPGYGPGVLTPEGSLATYIDQKFMPGVLCFKLYDPQGILPCLSGISTALAGAITGHWLCSVNRSKWFKAAGLLVAGILCLCTGQLWGHYFLICKNLWTGSFVLLTAGWSLLLLFLFYLVIDCIGLKKWAVFFVVIGTNPITIYMATRVINFGYTSNYLFGGMLKHVKDEPLVAALGSVAYILTWWLVLLLFYRKKIFLKV
jgi:predicted acyltransferase